jgi:CrcB protein
MSYLWIGLGSAIGGIGRHLCSSLVVRVFGESFPWGTILVNVIGSLVIGVVAALIPTESRFFFAADIRNFLMIGVLGSYTTFSTFSLQTLILARDGYWVSAGINVFLSIALCLIAVSLGYITANLAIR